LTKGDLPVNVSYSTICAGERFTPLGKDEAWEKNVDGTSTKESTGFVKSFSNNLPCIVIEKTKSETFDRHLKDFFFNPEKRHFTK
jgi:hypothetical protein